LGTATKAVTLISVVSILTVSSVVVSMSTL
jgi:hypothetical protein